ncbi:MAG: AzlC family ABC transporter permease [Azospirillaceae bacterium]
MSPLSPVVQGLRDGLPIVGGYFPLAITFGAVAAEGGWTAGEALAASILVFSGAAQFLLVGLTADGVPAATILALLVAINARLLVFGAPVARRLPGPRPRHAPLVAHGLTDAIFALSLVALDRMPAERRWGWLQGVAAGAFLAWAVGTLAGVAAGERLGDVGPGLSAALRFALPALFVTLLMPHFRGPTRLGLVAAAAGAGAATLAGLPHAGIPAAAILGTLVWYATDGRRPALR